MTGYAHRGWAVFPPEPRVSDWAACARAAALDAIEDPDIAADLDCEGTWRVGLDLLDNDALGQVGPSEPLGGEAVSFITRLHGWPDLHRAQVSVVYPGYPRPRAGESDAGFRYRRARDAAHVDGVIGFGPDKRRFVREPHGFILGLPLSRADPDAAPLVVWEGSHLILRRAFAEAFAGHDPSLWQDIDVTETYVAARRRVFETCARVEVPAPIGAAILVHRLTLHGVAPWAERAEAAPEGRMIAYFRPPMPGGVPTWVAPDTA